jgi:D-glycero-D-manno-heptose 1,7-bisphosphate phosphatase
MPSHPLRPALFLDRDGVIIQNRADYVKSVAEVEFIPGALAALAWAARTDALIVIATNQSAIGRGLVPWQVSDAIQALVAERVRAAGGRLDGVFVCPHVPEAGCACRKPKPGLLLEAAAALNIDLAASTMIGDALSDVAAGLAAGARAILVRTGRGAEEAPRLAAAGFGDVPVAADLAAAVALAARASGWVTKTPPVAGGVGAQTTAEILP